MPLYLSEGWDAGRDASVRMALLLHTTYCLFVADLTHVQLFYVTM